MKVSRNYLNKPHRIYGGGANILKGGHIPGAFASLGGGGGDIPRIFVPGGGIPRNIAPF